MKHCKRFLVLLFALLLIVALVACGDDGEGEPTGTSSSESSTSSSPTQSGGEPSASPMVFTLLAGGNAYSLTDYNGTDTQVTIPATWQDKPVTAIGARAFEGCTAVTSIIIPESVTSIGERAFVGCSALTEITLPKALTEMGAKILENCAALTKITFDAAYYPDQNATNDSLQGIGTQDIALVIGANVKRVGAFVFYNGDFKTITFAQNSVCTTIAANAFKGCKAVTALVIPDSVTSIGEGAFNGTSGLTTLELPFIGANKDVELTGAKNALFGYIFGTAEANGCVAVKQIYGSALADKVTWYIPASLANVTVRGGGIGEEAFAGCEMITDLTVGDAVTYIAPSALDDTDWFTNNTDDVIYAGKFLYACTERAQSLTSVQILAGTKGICSYAFLNMTELTTLHIPASVTFIGENAFPACYSLASFTVDVENTAYQAIDGVLFDKTGTTLVCYPAGNAATSYQIPDHVGFIASWAFFSASNLTTINIPASVVAIYNSAFFDLSGLEAFVVDEDNNSYFAEDGVLYNAENTTVKLIAYPGGATTQHFTIPETVTAIAENAFYGTQLDTLTIGTQVNIIEAEALSGCYYLIVYTPHVVAPQGWASDWTDAVVYYNVKEGGLITVSGMQILVSEKDGSYTAQITNYVGDAVASLTLPASVEYTPAGESTPVTVPVEKIGKCAFAYADIATFDFSQNAIRDLGTDAFFNTTFWNAQEDGIVYLNNMAIAFKGDQPEEGILVIEDGTTTICYKAFYNLSGDLQVVIPDTVTYIGGSIFSSTYTESVSIYYCFTSSEELADVEIDTNNIAWNGATFYYYSFNAPTTEGNFWCVDDNTIKIWNVAPTE